MERWLRYWLSTRTSIRPTTRLHYSRDVERFLIPLLGPIKLSELTSRQLNAIFVEIGKVSNRFGMSTSACTLQRLRTTLRVALNAPGLPAKIGNRETTAHAADHGEEVRHAVTAQPRPTSHTPST